MRFARAVLCVAALGCAAPSLANETVTYSYDALGRVITVAHAGTVNSGLNQAYTYDAADNRSNVTVTGSPSSSAPVAVVVTPLGTVLTQFPFTPAPL